MSESPTNEANAHSVRLHIDRTPYESPNPTTGEALYRLGNVPPGHVLFLEVQGDREDEEVPRDHTPIRLHTDEHFYSAEVHEREFTIVVNGQKKVVHSRKLTFMQLVALAFNPVPSGPNWVFTITYRNGPPSNPQGTLVEGQSIRIKNGMVFNVTATDKS